jgi:dTDP-4-dehydrorhamnose 3,5-epimerase-like enzyme
MGLYQGQLHKTTESLVAYIIQLKSFEDKRGKLTVAQDEIPFTIQRSYFISHVPDPSIVRGGHRHKASSQALICVAGSCEIYNHDGEKEERFLLDHPGKCLILEPRDWHTMQAFTKDAVLLVYASTKYDVNDYIDEPYPKH